MLILTTIFISLPSTMQSHTCTASGSLSFRCDSVRLKVVGSRSLSCLVHRRLLLVLVSLGCYNVGPTHTRILLHHEGQLGISSCTLCVLSKKRQLFWFFLLRARGKIILVSQCKPSAKNFYLKAFVHQEIFIQKHGSSKAKDGN